MSIKIGAFKIYPDAKLPVKSTKDSACFDVFAYLKKGIEVNYYDSYNHSNFQTLRDDFMIIHPNYRVLVPTGLKVDIPEGYSLRLHAKSGQSLKKGLGLANDEGIIDWGYTDSVYILAVNHSNNVIIIEDSERIAQIELVPVLDFQFQEVFDDITQKTDRNGGFGSTGIK